MNPLIEELDTQIHKLMDLHRRIESQIQDPEDAIGLEEGLQWLRGCRMTLNQKLNAQSNTAL